MSDEKKNDVSVKRRGFLKYTAWAAGGVVAGGAGLAVPLSGDKVLEQRYPEVPENQVELPPNGKRVVIIGGGLAGLQAGVELSARGFAVTVLERSGTPGGKAKTWRDRHFGPDDDPAKREADFPGYVRDHGTHAIWGFYNNLREFMGRYGWKLKDMPQDSSIYNFVDKDGSRSYLPNSTWPNPYDKLQLLADARKMQHVPDAERNDFIRLGLRLMSFDYADPKQRAFMDSMTFEAYGRKLGISERLIHTICDSLLEMAYFDNVQTASALTLANLFQLTAGSGDDMKVNLYSQPVTETFLQPMVDYIRAHGGRVLYNVEVSGFEKVNGRIKRVLTGELPAHRIRRCSVCGNLIIDGIEVGHECPFCGAHIDMFHELDEVERSARSWEADYFISALDIPAAKQIVHANLNVLGDEPYFHNILKLQPKAVYVCNLWFDGRGYWERRVHDVAGRPGICFFATGFQQLGITVNRSGRINFPDMKFTISPEFADRDITVIETQIAKTHLVAGKTTQEVAQLCYEELKTVMPDLPPPRDSYLNRWHNYNGYHVGSESHRPPVQSPIDNLLFIGDMAFVPHPAVFMEKTNVTAKWATNLLLEKAGIEKGRIKILQSGTPSVFTDALQRMTNVIV
ncbi:MAG: FAD-dependent oxidoreductase [Burkholderiaceae bacterium]|jgi:uncharacterized protein with NAD-binding domain and iron-sulfur cluster|nr:FAD-dependent oxidoreductase [Burkholderiaceae bacterium]